MPTIETRTLDKYIFDKLTEANWPEIQTDSSKQCVSCPKGKILSKKGNEFTLHIYFYSIENTTYEDSNRLNQIIFPTDFRFHDYIYFRKTGNYSLNKGKLFQQIINPLGKSIKTIKITKTGNSSRIYKNTLIIPETVFLSVMADAKRIDLKANSYRVSTQNYLANQSSQSYTSKTRKRTTYIQKGEFKFLVDRYYLKTKKKKKDFLQYLNTDDVKALEELLIQLLKNEVFSSDFLRFLDNYFIKEKLQEIVKIGQQILELKSEKTNTVSVRKVVSLITNETITQFETIWQKYFEKYLLYLIFTYKKIFPKVELQNISGDKKFPDFIGINHYNGLDIIEIKTHLKNILVWDSSHHNFYFSAEMSKAIVQVNNYIDAIVQRRFQNADDENKITNFTEEENLYHPRGIIIISSTDKIANRQDKETELKRDFTKLRNSLQNIEILTFDEVLGIADEYITNIAPQVQN